MTRQRDANPVVTSTVPPILRVSFVVGDDNTQCSADVVHGPARGRESTRIWSSWLVVDRDDVSGLGPGDALGVLAEGLLAVLNGDAPFQRLGAGPEAPGTPRQGGHGGSAKP